jgi:hypothetical protein
VWYEFFKSPMRTTFRSHLIPLDIITLVKVGIVYKNCNIKVSLSNEMEMRLRENYNVNIPNFLLSIVISSQGSIHNGSLLHSNVQYTTLGYSSQFF